MPTFTVREPLSPRKLWASPGNTRGSAIRASEGGGWFLNKTTEFTDPADQIVNSIEELRQISIFMFKKVSVFH